MSDDTLPRPGSVVLWWNGGCLAFGLVAGEDKGRVRVLPARGREERIKPSRVALDLGHAPVEGFASGSLDGEQLQSLEQRVRREAAGVEIRLVWEIVLESAADGDAEVLASLEDLATLAFDRPTAEARAATLLALLDDGLHFVRKAQDWAARGRDTVEQLRLERERIALRESRRREVFAALAAAAAGGAFQAQDHEVERRYLDALEQLALHNLQAPEQARDLALEALGASGLRYARPHEGAFRLLRRIGRFDSDDLNLQVRRFNLRCEFPEPVLGHALGSARREIDTRGRLDLTDLQAVSIDGLSTRDIDDLLSAEPLADGVFRLGVHIADPAAFVEPGDPVDEEALARGLAHYMPDLRIPMLPPSISEGAASLVLGQVRPALSFLVSITADGQVQSHELVRSVVRSSARLDYASCDRTLAEGQGPFVDLVRLLVAIGRARRAVRGREGAITIQSPEADLHVGPDGTITLDLLPADSPARVAVSEAMILAGDLAARFCLAQRVPAIWRRQAAPAELPEAWLRGETDPSTVRRVRRSLRRAETGLEPGPHAGLGLAAYVQASSPLRRFQDLALHRQIVSTLAGDRPRYDASQLARIAAATEAAEADARKAEQAADEYWLLRYLEPQTGQDLEALVVELKPRPVVQLVQTLLEHPLGGLAGVVEGQRILVRVEHVNPRAGLLVLRRVD